MSNIIEYRYVMLENVIQECLQHIRNGETEFELDVEDLTDFELDYITKEVEKRM